MPVPVPKVSWIPPHPVDKSFATSCGTKHYEGAIFSHNDSAFARVGRDLPREPLGPPPGLGSREQWLDSLPSWRRNKLREDVGDSGDLHEAAYSGLQLGSTFAEQASVDKENHLKMRYSPLCIPELSNLASMAWDEALPSRPTESSYSGYEADDDMGDSYGLSPLSTCATYHPSEDGQSDFDTEYDGGAFFPVHGQHRQSFVTEHGENITSTADASVLDLQEGGTPFADYVDAVVAADATYVSDHFVIDPQQALPAVETPRRQPPASTSEPLTDPSYIKAYRAMADPISDWVAEYVWKVCTTGMSLPPRFVGTGILRPYADKAPAYVSRSVRALLCSTLLQPSGIALALWYIARLPVFFDWQASDATMPALEAEFRAELFGDRQFIPAADRSAADLNVPFRLILLGCMLANKWLDDHTFSNKTWHSISEVPIKSINRLELLALGILAHDLSVPQRAWDQWLAHLRSYNSTLSPYPAPIRRPSATDSGAVIRKLLEDLILLRDLPSVRSSTKTPPEPVFAGLLDNREKPMMRMDEDRIDVVEIDLDEDGPLRDEYVPKRRSSTRSTNGRVLSLERRVDAIAPSPILPPPAEWSPQADPPLERSDRRERYFAVQPTNYDKVIQASRGRSFSAASSVQQPSWSAYEDSAPTGHQFSSSRDSSSDSRVLRTIQTLANGYPLPLLTACPPISHTRSTLASCAAPLQSQSAGTGAGHYRSYSQSYAENDAHAYQPLAHTCGPVGYSTARHTHTVQAEPAHFRPLWLRA